MESVNDDAILGDRILRKGFVPGPKWRRIGETAIGRQRCRRHFRFAKVPRRRADFTSPAEKTMIIFLHEEKAYRHWVTHHRQGFVLDGRHKPKIGHLTLHRAVCPTVKPAGSGASHLTTGPHLKACSLDAAELRQWGMESSGAEPAVCNQCRPLETSPPEEEIHLTRIGKEILEYVLEAASIHFEPDTPPYRLSVQDIADCLGKEVSHLTQSLRPLVHDGLLIVDGWSGHGTPAPRKIVYPTAKALRTMADFAEADDEALEAELAKLK